ncbi:MAG: cytochrome C oxidase Cbb3 [bacterium]|nr:cytochrome C oxidase Cbb3 [bacterium]
MFKQYFEVIEGIDIYPLISLIIFFVFFLFVIIWFFKANKGHLKEMEMIPLDPCGSDNSKDEFIQ